MINRRVSLFYRYTLEASHHMVCPCALYSVCVVCPGTSELVGQQRVWTNQDTSAKDTLYTVSKVYEAYRQTMWWKIFSMLTNQYTRAWADTLCGTRTDHMMEDIQEIIDGM